MKYKTASVVLLLFALSIVISVYGLQKKHVGESSLIIAGLPEYQSVSVEYFTPDHGAENYQQTSQNTAMSVALPKAPEALPYYYVTSKLPGEKDVSFQVQKNTGLVKVSANGFSSDDVVNFTVNGKTLGSNLHPDWSGQIEFAHQLQNLKNKDNLVCFDVGGYRAGSMAVCHYVENSALPVAFSISGLGKKALNFAAGKVKDEASKQLTAAAGNLVQRGVAAAGQAGKTFDAASKIVSGASNAIDTAKKVAQIGSQASDTVKTLTTQGAAVINGAQKEFGRLADIATTVASFDATKALNNTANALTGAATRELQNISTQVTGELLAAADGAKRLITDEAGKIAQTAINQATALIPAGISGALGPLNTAFSTAKNTVANIIPGASGAVGNVINTALQGANPAQILQAGQAGIAALTSGNPAAAVAGLVSDIPGAGGAVAAALRGDPAAAAVSLASNIPGVGSTLGGLGLGSGGDASGFARLIAQNWVKGMMLMANQLTDMMMAQVNAIGMFFDAKHQLETQRIFQLKTAEAHKDYHPSEQICKIGTAVRDLAATEARMALTREVVNKSILGRELISGDRSTSEPGLSDVLGRIQDLKTKYCSPSDGTQGMRQFCKSGSEPERINKDVDYTRALEMPLTLDVDFLDEKVTADEEDIFQLINNLYSDEAVEQIPSDLTKSKNFPSAYKDMRSIVAMRGIARNSMANMITQKAAGPNHANNAGPHIKALIKEMGLDDTTINEMLGDNPSYFAQMEVLTKKIYQNPDFITHLYDKPANVERIRTAMHAIKLMHDRDIHAALMRREMLLSMLMELKARDIQNPQRPNSAR